MSTSHRPLRCLIIGERALPIQCAGMLEDHGHGIAGVFSGDASVIGWAEQKGLRHLLLDHKTSGGEILRFAAAEPFDYLFSIVNGFLVPQELLGLAKLGSINFHDAILPDYAGFNTTTHALMNRRSIHGITWHLMEGKVDSGPIVKQAQFPVGDEETAFSLNVKCYEAALQSFGELVVELGNGTEERVAQDLTKRKFFSRYKHAAGTCLLPLDRSAAEVEAFVRALDFGPYANPIAAPKLYVKGKWWIVPKVELGSGLCPSEPGLITSLTAERIGIATGNGEILVRELFDLAGKSLPLLELGLQVGDRIDALAEDVSAEITTLHAACSPHEPYWVERLAGLNPLTLGEEGSGLGQATLSFPAPAKALALTAAFFGRTNGGAAYDVGFSHPGTAAALGIFAERVPLHVEPAETFDVFEIALGAELERVYKSRTYTKCLTGRYPALRAAGQPRYPVVFQIDGEARLDGAALLVHFRDGASTVDWVYDPAKLSEQSVSGLKKRFDVFVSKADGNTPLARIPLLAPEELQTLLVDWNATETGYPRETHIHERIEAQAALTPDAAALTFEGASLSYAELNRRANQLAAHIGGAESIIGIFLERSLDLVVALVATWKVGAAYLPLDPGYPPDRTALIVDDAQATLILAADNTVERVPRNVAARVMNLDRERAVIDSMPVENRASAGDAEKLAYVIYTSGSTGKPKGVQITHRNVANFFAGMDREIEVPDKPVWLAITSISFDISVLELFWTLTRGFHIVLASEAARLEGAKSAARKVDFSLFYFANNAEGDGGNRYRLLLEGAKFGDQNGFEAVWTPERHFHAFGGLYPNPAVTSAAIAATTERIKIRAGSVVLPLHSPIRVAEEWSLVDNLSNGRVAISFAAGWNERDFVFAPQNYAQNRQVMLDYIESVRTLWRGGSIQAVDGKGKETAITTLPRPIQPELPVWITAAGNPETFRIAGSKGYNLLTHLLGQKVEQLAEKIKVYRQARKNAGFDPETGHVTLMLHTFVGDSLDEVRDTVRAPFTDYLKTSLDLIKNSPWSFPAFSNRPELNDPKGQLDLGQLTQEEMDVLLEHAFLRYFETSGLFGTVEQCVEMSHRLSALGVNEIACLIDFGVGTDIALRGLKHLNRVRQAAQANDDYSIPALVRRHGVTHLQCTPSLARLLAASPETLSSLKTLLVGGEALPLPLAQTLRDAVPGQVLNMYGPTETTVWSTVYALPKPCDTVLIGRPIANTQVYIVDTQGQPVPVGEAGELWIGGDGVARGYHHRAELTAERFVPDTFGKDANGRLYRTGDLARYLPNGEIEFLGRLDFQVKIRGYRIEIGEIESALAGHPRVQAAVVTAREDRPGEKRLVAYLIANGDELSTNEIRQHLEKTMPPSMIPSAFMYLPAFPLTPNKKVDRKALPAPENQRAQSAAPFSAPSSELEQLIARVWRDVLRLERVGLNDNFFDLGGHSLLIVEVNAQLKKELNRDLSVVQMFRFPTISMLANHLSAGVKPAGPSIGAQRAEARRQGRRLQTSTGGN